MNIERGNNIISYADIFINQLNDFHSTNRYEDVELEVAFYKDVIKGKQAGIIKPEGLYFTPSSISNCERSHILKANNCEKNISTFPYQQRWLRNSLSVHQAIQKDIFYFNKMDYRLVIDRDTKGNPLWEHNLKDIYYVDYIPVVGMMDGILLDTQTGKQIGFEFKTKSNTLYQCGEKSLRYPNAKHIEQCVLYSIIFNISDFIICYECVAKDYWNKGKEAKKDIVAFDLKIDKETRAEMVTKMKRIYADYKNNIIPEVETGDHCMFCNYTDKCREVGNGKTNIIL